VIKLIIADGKVSLNFGKCVWMSKNLLIVRVFATVVDLLAPTKNPCVAVCVISSSSLVLAPEVGLLKSAKSDR
jgi:hypothetical protein